MSDATVLALLGRLRALDVRLRLEDGALRWAAPPGAMTDALRDELRARRDALVAVLARDAAATAPIPRRAAGLDVAPLSFGQRRLWFLERAGSGGAAYNIAVVARLAGRPDVAALGDALAALVARHEVLRSGVVSDGPEPLQRVHAAVAVPLPVHDLRTVDAPRRAAALEAALDAEARRPFDLATPPLLRAVLHVVADDASVLQLTVHHAAADGWSLRVLAAELSACYDARRRGAADPLAALPLQYGDFAAWERQRFGVSTASPALDATRARLAGAPPLLDLPGDRRRPASTGGDAGAATRAFPAGLAARVAALATRLGTTPFVVQLAALQVLLASLTGQDDVVVGSPVANRTRTALEPLVGFFVNTLVLRARLAGDPAFADVVRAVHADAVAAQEAGEVPVDRVVELLAPRRAMAHHPLFQVLFTVQGGEVPSLTLAPLPAAPLETRFVAAKFDLALYVEERAGEASVTATWPCALFDEATATGVLAAWLDLLARATEAPATPLSRLGDDWAVVAGAPAGAAIATLDAPGVAGPVAERGDERATGDGRATLHPLAGDRLTVVDGRGAVVPPGGVGTLVVVSPRTGGLPHRTPWRARRRADGTIALVGAADRAVTIGGYAVHLDDVRRAIAALAGVDDVAVLAAPDGGVAAFVAGPGDAAALRAALAATVAEPLVPAHLVVRGAWAPSREAASALLATLADVAGDGARDATASTDAALEAAIAAAWRAVLQRPHVAPTENFFDAGGHSLLLLALHARITETTGRDFPVVDLFRFPTVRSLAAHLAGGAAAPATARDDAQARAERQRAALVRQRARMAAAGLRPLDPSTP